MTSHSRITKLSILDLVEGLAMSMDLVSPAISNHHRRVAYISWQIAQELDLPDQEKTDLVLAAMLHDCGALSLPNRKLNLLFETNETEGFSLSKHAEVGYYLLRKFGPFSKVALIVRYHHHPWQSNGDQLSEAIPSGASILHLADRLDVLIKKSSNKHNILYRRDDIIHEIKRETGSQFNPEFVAALANLAHKESFWLDIVNISMSNTHSSYLKIGSENLNCDNVLEMTELFSHIIDFRSHFTASHSSAVSVLSGSLARLAGFSEDECLMMKIGGNLHDLGKLAIPLEILEKPGKLTREQFNVIKSHTYYTFKILSKFRDMDCIRRWAAYHHERIDGEGYPFKIAGEMLDRGSRIVAVADVYTALRENRPYRQEMAIENSVAILQKMSGQALDGDIVNLLISNLPELEKIVQVTKEHSQEDYQALQPHL